MAALDDQITAYTAEITRQKTVNDSIVAMVNGIPKLIADAVTAATAAGATPAQLASFTALGAALKANDDEIQAAVTANTPPPTGP